MPSTRVPHPLTLLRPRRQRQGGHGLHRELLRSRKGMDVAIVGHDARRPDLRDGNDLPVYLDFLPNGVLRERMALIPRGARSSLHGRALLGREVIEGRDGGKPALKEGSK